MIVLFRSCEANLSPGSLGNEKEDKPRWNGKNKLEILRKCYLSIQEGIDENDTIIIINDRTSEGTLQWMDDNTKASFRVKNITSLDDLRKDHPYPNYHPIVVNACPDLMEIIVDIAENNKDQLIYVCEDDYLHMPEAINNMKKLYLGGYKGFYAPYDYPDRYTIDKTRICHLFASVTGHVRSIPSSTLTLAALGSTWLLFKYELLRAGAFADDTWTWKAFQQVEAVCPIPGQATHLQEGCIAPYVDWGYRYNNV